jgi:AraC family transcriptional regulator
MSASRDSRQEYERRMHRVIEHIDRHLDSPLDLAALAEVAHFSAFHFHRLFAAWMGETLGDYLRRRRLEVAAMRLASQPRLSVLRAALSVGFGSGEAFSRAFKTHFACSPSAWRASRHAANSHPGHAKSNLDQDAAAAFAENGAGTSIHVLQPLEVTIIERAPAHIAYLRHTGPYGRTVNQFWRDTVYPWLVANEWLGRPRYGIGHDDPSITDEARCRYDACVEIPREVDTRDRAMTTTIPGGRYAVLPFEGHVMQVVQAWNRLLGEWLPSSGLQLDARPCYEYYDGTDTGATQTGVFSCDICIPVAPL